MMGSALTRRGRPTERPTRAVPLAAVPFLVPQTMIAAWLLAYYLLPNTLLGRISPGGLVMEVHQPPATWLCLGGTVLWFALAAALLAAPALRRAQPRFLPVWLLVSVFCVPLLAAAADGSGEPEQSLAAASVVGALATGAIAAALVQGRVGPGLTAVASLAALYAIVYQRERTHGLLSGTVLRAGGTFDDPNNLYVLMLVALPLAVAGALQAERAWPRFAYLVAASAEFSALMMTWFRGGAIGLALALATFVYMVTRSTRAAVTVLICAVALAGVVTGVRMAGPQNRASATVSAQARVRQWWSALATFSAHPITGVGVNSYNAPVVSTRGGVTTYNVTSDPKGILLHWLVERGIAGGLLFVLFVWTIASLVRSASPDTDVAAIAAAWVGLLAVGCVDTPLGMPGRYAGTCCFGLLLGATAMLQQREETGPSAMEHHAD